MRPLNIAHRGASLHELENSAAAFERAASFGAEMIEMDVRLTRDGVPVIMHDERIDRTCDRPGLLAEMTLEGLRTVRLLNGEAVPVLAELLERFQGRLQFDLEIKENEAVGPVLALIKRMGLEDDVLLTSFSVAAIRQVNDVAPHLRNALLLGTASFHPLVRAHEALPVPRLRQSRTRAAAIFYPLLYGYLERLLVRLGYDLYIWTADEEPVFAKYAESGVKGIITNRCDRLAEFLRHRPEILASERAPTEPPVELAGESGGETTPLCAGGR